MNKYNYLLTAAFGAMLTLATAKAQNGAEPYFVQTFEDTIPAKENVTTAPLHFQIEGQGEWIFNYAFKGTNQTYIKDGSKGCLRMPKKSDSSPASYVVTPVVDRGIGQLTFDEGRSKRSLRIYASADGGSTWTLVKDIAKTTASNTVNVNMADANRLKLENYGTSGDADVDNLTVYPYGAGPGGGSGDSPTVDNGVVETFWCAPDGDDTTADGSAAKPFRTLQRAADLAGPADTIMMRAGTYAYDARQNLAACGTQEKLITLKCPDGRAVLDFSSMPYHKHSDNPQQGIRLTGSYWHFLRIDITNASDNGLLIERESGQGLPDYQAHDNLIEDCRFYRNGDTGLQMKNLASWNRVVNCDSYLNCDEGQGDADGFAPKISVGDGNYFYGCRAWLNSDDGWDVFYKQDSGQADNVSIVLENCICYKNGFLDEETVAPDGNGNGFKCGSNQGAMNLYLNRCLAVCNKSKGFDQNHNSGDIILNNCTGMALKKYGDSKAYSYRIYEPVSEGHEVRLTNCVAINDRSTTDKKNKDGTWKEGENGKQGLYGRVEVDTTLERITVTTCEFRYAAPDEFVAVDNHAELTAPRQADGSLAPTTFAHLRPGSSLIDRGTPVEPTTYRGIPVSGISYEGAAPDLGAYEYTAADLSAIRSIRTADRQGNISVQQTQGGLLLLTVSPTTGDREFRLTATDAGGRVVGRHAFRGATTAISLPRGLSILSVEGDRRYHATLKVVASR